MVKSVERAMAELPEADQEQIGRQLLSHVKKLRALRAAVNAGTASLDAGKGTPLDIEEFLRPKNMQHGG
jgi:hypothetical protein